MQTGIHKVTYSRGRRYAVLHSYGCNFRCRGCSYKLLMPDPPTRILGASEIITALERLELDTVYFMGWEPTLNPHLGELLASCKERPGVSTRLGCTNGSRLPTENLDGANFGFKAFDEELHIEYTVQSVRGVLENFRRGFDAGLTMKASGLFIPEYIGLDQIEKLARWLAEVSPDMPFHIMGYIPVPGAPWRGPTSEEMADAVQRAKNHLTHVTFTHLTPEEAQEHRRHHDKHEERVL